MELNKNQVYWDKTNIGENYPGITLPLTYSFVRKAYKNVYINFLCLLGFPNKVLEEKEYVFDNMLGYLNGQLFYNMKNWYELVKLLPGYKYNKEFFENMLDPAAKNSESVERAPTSSARFFTGLRFIFLITFTSPIYKKFDTEYDSAIMYFKKIDLKSLSTFELVKQFEYLQKRLFKVWAYTIVNDFRVMVFYGLLTKFISSKAPDETNNIANNICAKGSVPKSVEPLNFIINLALTIKQNNDYLRAFSLSPEEAYKALNQSKNKTLLDLINVYIDKFGERYKNELKLEEENFKDDPLNFISILKSYILLDEKYLNKLLHNIENKHQSVSKISNLSLGDQIVFSLLKKISIYSIYKREEFRIKRGKVFSIAREFYIELGERMVNAGELNTKSDVFYLYNDELLDYVTFNKFTDSFKDLVASRKEILNNFKQNILSRSVKTSGLPSELIEHSPINSSRMINRYVGKPTSIGVVLNTSVFVMPTFDSGADFREKILVTTSTDPGWTLIFPMIKGIIIEEGGLLSHASIVAREFGIPCIIIPNATKVLKTGDIINLDSQNGFIEILNQ